MTLRFFHGRTGRKRHETEQLAEMSRAILDSGIHSEESPTFIFIGFSPGQLAG